MHALVSKPDMIFLLLQAGMHGAALPVNRRSSMSSALWLLMNTDSLDSLSSRSPAAANQHKYHNDM